VEEEVQDRRGWGVEEREEEDGEEGRRRRGGGGGEDSRLGRGAHAPQPQHGTVGGME
jgi:hypothetical protein